VFKLESNLMMDAVVPDYTTTPVPSELLWNSLVQKFCSLRI
jgi:hypothetical protein